MHTLSLSSALQVSAWHAKQELLASLVRGVGAWEAEVEGWEALVRCRVLMAREDTLLRLHFVRGLGEGGHAAVREVVLATTSTFLRANPTFSMWLAEYKTLAK